MTFGYIWIVLVSLCVFSVEGQRYSCLTTNYPGRPLQNTGPRYGLRNDELFSRSHSSSSQSEELDEMEDAEDADEGGSQGGEEAEIELEADEEVETEDIIPANRNFNSTTSPHFDDRRKRQAPVINVSKTATNKTSSHSMESIGLQLSRSLQNITTSQRDDSIHDEKETAYEYTEYNEYDQTDISSDTTRHTNISSTSNATFSGVIRCPNPSQKVHLRKVTTGYSSTGYCVRDTTYCAKEISDFKEIMNCEGTFGECKLELPREDIDSCEQSNYVKIEYDCIYDHSLFDICSKIQVNRWKEIAIKSPSYPSKSPVLATTVKTCECEIATDDKSSLSISYLRSDMSGSDDKCDDEVLLFEEKFNAKQSSKFQVTGEVCGEKMAYTRRFGDSQIRLTYLLGSVDDTKERGGFLTKISAHSYTRRTSLINVKCSTVGSGAAGLLNFRRPVKAFPTPFRKTIISPVVVKERHNFLPSVPVLPPSLHQPTTTQKPQASTPRWRIGPRGRKYIPRPGNPNGPLFLDGLGLGDLRRRFPPGKRPIMDRRYRPGLRRRKLVRTTAAPAIQTTTKIQSIENGDTGTSTLPPTMKISSTTVTSTVNKTIGAVAPVASVNSAGAVKADESGKPVEVKKSGGDKGTLIAVIASMASIISIMVSVGFYYFYRKRKNNQSGRKTVLSETSSVWFSEYYYGITNFMKNKFTKGGRKTLEGESSGGSTEESTYESYENDVTNDGLISVDMTDNPPLANTSLGIFNQTQVLSQQNEKSDFGYSKEKNPAPSSASLEVKLVAPPRKKKKLIKTLPSLLEPKFSDSKKTISDYDNRLTPATATATDNTYNSPEDTYDNCISTEAAPVSTTPLTPIVEITEHESTEYASIPEMIEMFNAEC